MGAKKKKKVKKLTAQAAAIAAADYYKVLTAEPSSKLGIAETELSPRGNYWLITLSIDNLTQPFMYASGMKEFRVFKVDIKSGEVVSMKVKKFD